MKSMNFINHFKTITNHKLLVMKYCFKIGLYKQGILHDFSKYSWVEFSAGVKYYQGFRSPNYAQKVEEGYSSAWLHHKGRNKHHFEYWIDYTLDPNDGLKGMRMPLKYVVEMFIDRMCASKNYQKDKYTDRSALEYYNAGNYGVLIIIFAVVALFLMILIEGSRVPVDDPATHLELTMIHEVMILDNSGSDLALILWANSIKMFLISSLIANILLPQTLETYSFAGLYLLIMFAISVIIGTIESGMARIRMSHIFEFVFIMSSLALVVLSLVVARMFGG